ncbi:MAG: amidohydrolase family protein [Planctomycetaceae bacterium]
MPFSASVLRLCSAAIDVHAHFGRYDCGRADLINELMAGDASVVAERARRANVRLTIVSPLESLLPRGKADAVFADTSSARSITPNLIEWAVREVGAERVLFGTDSPLYHTSMQRVRIDHADLTDREKRLILCENAERLFELS